MVISIEAGIVMAFDLRNTSAPMPVPRSGSRGYGCEAADVTNLAGRNFCEQEKEGGFDEEPLPENALSEMGTNTFVCECSACRQFRRRTCHIGRDHDGSRISVRRHSQGHNKRQDNRTIAEKHVLKIAYQGLD